VRPNPRRAARHKPSPQANCPVCRISAPSRSEVRRHPKRPPPATRPGDSTPSAWLCPPGARDRGLSGIRVAVPTPGLAALLIFGQGTCLKV
jgi:hypothetical protein